MVTEKKAESQSARAARKAAKRGRARRRQAFLAARHPDVDERALSAAMARLLAELDEQAATEAFPVNDAQRWVPIGPSVVRRGQAEGRPRVSGRIRDLAVDGTGTRAYAATAKGGVWYTSDSGTTWDPIGGWADRARTIGGDVNAQACGCLLVAFDTNTPPIPANDVVLVGTGEPQLGISPTGGTHGGIGILSAVGPATAAVGAQPWEPTSGLNVLEGFAIHRLARHPASVAASLAAANLDRIAAGTSQGLFIGTRVAIPANGPIPAHNAYQWTLAAGISVLVNGPPPLPPPPPPPPPPDPAITDVLWIAGGANGRLFVALDSLGVAFSDNAGVTFTWVVGLTPPGVVQGYLSLARSPGGNVYVLAEAVAGNQPTVWQIANPTAAAPAAVAMPVLNAQVDGNGNPLLWGTQRDYDQAIAVDQVGGNDRIAIGGSVVWTGTDWGASLWCFDVAAGPLRLVPSPNVSRVNGPSAAVNPGDGADQPGLIGNNVHGDIHSLVWTGPAANRQLWVGCDGGVFVSTQGGRVNSFAPRVTGLAALEPGFVANHPSSSHFAAAGFQDNGTQVRTGDTVWEETFEGDGGGTVFHPIRSQYVITQWTSGTWNAQPATGYVDPIARGQGGPGNAALGAEDQNAAFYSGASAIANAAGTIGRIALGTNRVWVTDDVGNAVANTWMCLPAATGAARDARATNPNTAANLAFGVPAAGLGPVITVKWVTPTVLLVLYQGGVVSYSDNANGTWNVTQLLPAGRANEPNSANTMFTDVAPLGNAGHFYLTTTGELVAQPGQPAAAAQETCFYFDPAGAGTWTATNLRNALPAPSPCDPAYAAVVDPTNNNLVYVGTVTGVWQGTRTNQPLPAAPFTWVPFVNGLPQATVQDLQLWSDPAGAAGAPLLLRAAIQSRGIWEVDLAAATEPVRTFVRVHERDDRRRFPTPMADPRRRTAATPRPAFASPDIVIRPRWPRAAVPNWQLGTGNMVNTSAPPYQLWTFQTAFRWLYPSVAADGRWTDQLGDLIQLHRSIAANGLTAGRAITQAVWNQVLGNTRIDAAGQPSNNPADSLAVYRAPWQSSVAPNALATEVDAMELVVAPSVVSDEWRVYREPCTVDVVIHHRDTRPRPANDAWALLAWRSDPSANALTTENQAPLQAYALALAQGNPLPVLPAGWNVSGQVQLSVSIDARIPRAVSIDVDLSAVTAGHRVLFVAFVGSGADVLSQPVVGAPATLTDLVRNWPYAAMRLVRVVARP